LMAVFFRGLTEDEVVALTKVMWKSGLSLPRDKKSRDEVWIDKHSTGGVGDKTSLLLVPIVSEVGKKLGIPLKIPMISGRALGHSGGTLDKLESVPGFTAALSLETAMKNLESEHYFMMGQTADLDPADRRLYALRDAVSTVESIPLIVSSILSKKLAESLDVLVLDVKSGDGAFMDSPLEAKQLAQTLIKVARAFGLRATGLLTSMDEPLGQSAGNFLEIAECADFLKGKKTDEGLAEVTYALASQMILLAGHDSVSGFEAERHCRQVVESGDAYRAFIRMFEIQGGDFAAFVKDRDNPPSDLKVLTVKSPAVGYLTKVNTRRVGLLINELGGGRETASATIDARVGFEFAKKVGDRLEKGEEIARVYYREGIEPKFLEKKVSPLFVIEDSTEKPPRTQWILEDID
jgi:thymidine phosphorylase